MGESMSIGIGPFWGAEGTGRASGIENETRFIWCRLSRHFEVGGYQSIKIGFPRNFVTISAENAENHL
jgi:hypothetical protein